MYEFNRIGVMIEMYLSRVELNLQSRSCRKLILSPHKLHIAVESCFSFDKNVQQRERHLWRIDTLRGKTYLIILSENIPNLDEISIKYGYGAGTGETRLYDKLKNSLTVGSKWRFRLKANPTYKVDHVVHSHNTVAYQLKWLIRKAGLSGFSVTENSFQVVNRERVVFHKENDTENKNCVTLMTVVYEGVLTVTDVELFWNVLCSGIGRGKAYGCGLLTLA